MKNPLLYAKEEAHLSQRKIATLLDVSQQYVQRIETGQCADLPEVFADFYNGYLSTEQRREILERLWDELNASIIKAVSVADWYVIKRNIQFTSCLIEDIYKFYVIADRGLLPDAFKVYNLCRTIMVPPAKKFQFETALYTLLDCETDLTALAQKLHVQQVTLQRYFSDRDDVVRDLPEEFFKALSQTGRINV